MRKHRIKWEKTICKNQSKKRWSRPTSQLVLHPEATCFPLLPHWMRPTSDQTCYRPNLARNNYFAQYLSKKMCSDKTCKRQWSAQSHQRWDTTLMLSKRGESLPNIEDNSKAAGLAHHRNNRQKRFLKSSSRLQVCQDSRNRTICNRMYCRPFDAMYWMQCNRQDRWSKCTAPIVSREDTLP